MSEEHVAQPAVPPDTPVRSYEDVLAKHPDMHPGLKEQVQRLAIEAQVERPAEPAVPEEGTMAYLLHETNVQAEYVATTSDTLLRTGLPYDTNSVLKKGEYTAEELGGLLNSHVAMQAEAQKRVSGKEIKPEEINVRSFLETLPAIPTETLRELYNAPSEVSKGLRTIMENAADDYEKYYVLKQLTRIHNVSDVLDLYDPDSEVSKDTTLVHYRQQKNGDAVPLVALQESGKNWGEKEIEQSNAKREWADKYLERVVGMRKDMRDDLLFASYSRISDKTTGHVVNKRMGVMLETTAFNMKSLGPEKAAELREHAGIVNFDYYYADQLHLTAELLRGNPTVVEHLKQHDVVLHISDARGDYNGSLSNNHAVYATQEARTVVFEISDPANFYRHLLSLEKHGIKPSTLVVAAHGNVGLLGFGDEDKQFVFSQQHVGKTSGLRHVVKRFMQDDRGIDNPDAKGLRRVILDSCYQGKEHKTTRPRQPHEKRQRLHNLTRRKGDVVTVTESMAETLVHTANDPRLRVYSSDRGMLSGRYANSARVRFFKSRKTEADPIEHLPISEMYIDNDGIIHRSEVEEIVIDPARERAAA